MKIEWEWEKLDADTYRAKVIGGWIVTCDQTNGIAGVFVPDPNHEWEINPTPKE